MMSADSLVVSLASASHAYFYFRDPQCQGQSADTDDRADGPERNSSEAAKLSALKTRICASGPPVREGYLDGQDLGRLALADLSAVINRVSPESETDVVDRETAGQEVFIESREKAYLARRSAFVRLDEHAASDGPPLVVLGESGIGKLALLANLSNHYREAHPDQFVMEYFGPHRRARTGYPCGGGSLPKCIVDLRSNSKLPTIMLRYARRSATRYVLRLREVALSW